MQIEIINLRPKLFLKSRKTVS